jgi:mycofactocin precursor
MSAKNTAPETVDPVQTEPEVVLEDLIEEVSIDGMCGVY